MMPAIRVENLSKLYHIGSLQEGPRTLKAALAASLVDPLKKLQRRKPKKLATHGASTNGRVEVEDEPDTIWALRDVSFEVGRGEVVGIVGANGSGKSTLMKILSRVTPPTSGRVEVRGRVGSLLEVGTGFDQEFTGRENIYLSGPILGMSRKEIEAKLDQIVAFADIAQFLDTPVKHYSSGMQLRLGFAVAAHLDPEILLVDEALAVGDAAFQSRCIARMTALARSGKTVLFVSHDTDLISKLCSRSIILNKGKVQLEGPTEAVVKEYLTSLMGEDSEVETTGEADSNTAAAEEQLHDLLDNPDEEPVGEVLADELANTLLAHLPAMLAEELVDRLGPPLAAQIAEHLAPSSAEEDFVPDFEGEVDEREFQDPFDFDADGQADWDGEPELEEAPVLQFQIAPLPDLAAEPGTVGERVFQLRHWDQVFATCQEYLDEANAAGKDVNVWLEEHYGSGNCRLVCDYTIRPLLAEDLRVCELGPSMGRWARHVAPRLVRGEFHLVEGDPWSRNFLAQYFQAQPQVRVYETDGYVLPFPEIGGFDLAYVLDLFLGFPLGRIDLYVREFARILRPGGRLVFQYADTTRPLIWDFLRNYGTKPNNSADTFSYHPPELIDRVLREAGFPEVRRIHLDEVYQNYPFTAVVAVRGDHASLKQQQGN